MVCVGSSEKHVLKIPDNIVIPSVVYCKSWKGSRDCLVIQYPRFTAEGLTRCTMRWLCPAKAASQLEDARISVPVCQPLVSALFSGLFSLCPGVICSSLP